MSANDKILLRVGVVVIVLLGAILACGPTPDGEGISVVINSPTDGSTVTVGQEVQINSTSTSEDGIDRVDLTINGGMIRHDSPSEETPSVFRIVQAWTPTEEGQVEVSVVAYDATGASAQASISLQVAASAAGGDDDATAAPDATAIPPELIPTETPLPPVTTEAGCTLDSKYVADITIPDGTVMSPGAAYVKTWKVRNSGTCDWEAGYTLVFVSGEQMGGPASVPLPVVAAGAEADISVNLAAPNSYGTFKGTWRIRSDDGKVFGTNLTVLIEVPPPATDTPTPTNTPTIEPTVKTVTEEPPSIPYTEQVSSNYWLSKGTHTRFVSCPTGSILVGGGYGANSDVVIGANHPQGGIKWRVDATNPTDSDKEINVYAICLHDAPSASTTQVKSSVDLPGGSTAGVSTDAVCPAGSLVTGGGWFVNPHSKDARIVRSMRVENGWRTGAQNITTSDQKLSAYAICLSGLKGTISDAQTSVTVPENSHDSAVATCKSGSVVTGGGFQLQSFEIRAIGSRATDKQQWIVHAWNTTKYDKVLISQVVCLSLP